MVLGISATALTGEKPWPRRRLRRAPVSEPGPRRRRRRRRVGSVEVTEVDLRRGVPGADGDIRDQATVTTWTVPAEMIEARGLRVEDIVVVQAPAAVPGSRIAVGDWLLVELGHHAGRKPGVVVTWDGSTHTLALRRVNGALFRFLMLAEGEEVEDVAVVGRVVARWTWL